MTLIDGDRIITGQIYDDEHEEFTQKKMSIIDFINAYTYEGVTTTDDMLEQIRAEIDNALSDGMIHKKTVLGIIDKYKAESEGT